VEFEQYQEVAWPQSGLITRSQVLRISSENELAYALRKRWLIKVRPNVYRLWGAPETWTQQLRALTLSAGHLVVSHRSAARLLQLGNHWRSDVIDVSTTARSGRTLLGAVVHRSILPDHHVTHVDGIRLTTVERTLIDLAATSHPKAIERALDYALSAKRTSLNRLVATLNEVHRPGKPKLGTIRTLLDARQEQLSHSELERRAWMAIRTAGLPAPVSQHPVATEYCTYHIDLAYPAERLGIECDGYVAHGERSQFDDDARRTTALVAQGWRLLRYTSNTVDYEFIDGLRKALLRP
jgi:very-short-patch-repair endonuclease